MGFGLDEKPDMGPLVTSRDRDRILKMVADDVASGAKLELGGGIPAGKTAGNFIEPTIITGLTTEMRCFREEIFGPRNNFV